MSVAAFHARYTGLLRELGAATDFHGCPNEVAEPILFVDDHLGRPYDAEAVTRYFHAYSPMRPYAARRIPEPP